MTIPLNDVESFITDEAMVLSTINTTFVGGPTTHTIVCAMDITIASKLSREGELVWDVMDSGIRISNGGDIPNTDVYTYITSYINSKLYA